MSVVAYITRQAAFDYGYPPEVTTITLQGIEVEITELTDAQVAALSKLCAGFGVPFDPSHYLIDSFDLPKGWAQGWLGNSRRTIYVGCSPEGEVHS